MSRIIEHLWEKSPSWVLQRTVCLCSTEQVSPCAWDGVRCDAARQVTHITWNYENLGQISGNMSWKFLPNTVQELYCEYHRGLLGGELELGGLPTSMTVLSLRTNKHSGSLNLGELRRGMRRLNLWSNVFSGPVDLGYLPDTLESLVLQDNNLSGEITVGYLPHSLRGLHLGRNEFTGILDLENFLCIRYCEDKKCIESGLSNPHATLLYVEDNFFTGFLPEGALPPGVRYHPQKMKNVYDFAPDF